MNQYSEATSYQNQVLTGGAQIQQVDSEVSFYGNRQLTPISEAATHIQTHDWASPTFENQGPQIGGIGPAQFPGEATAQQQFSVMTV